MVARLLLWYYLYIFGDQGLKLELYLYINCYLNVHH